jgi:hypothetical protein
VGIGVVAFWPGEREPEYDGKKLSEWLRAYELGSSNDNERKIVEREQQAATDAIQHIGTNALPWLLKRIAYNPPVWKEKIGAHIAKINSKLLTHWYLEGDRLGFDALQGFRLLGPRAAPAMPELTRMMRGDTRRGVGRDWPMDALSYIGRDGFPTLLAAMGSPKTEFDAAERMDALAKQGVDIGPAMPELLLIDRRTRADVENYEKANPRSQYYDPVFVTPGLLDENRPFLIPALTNCLHHTNSDVRVEAADALRSLGDKARPAVPALKEALDDRVIAVQEAAINALEKIAPEVLTNGVKDF